MNDSSTAFLRLANQARSRIIEVTPKDVSQAKPLPLFLDIREAEEYARGHIAGARHLSRGVLEQKIGEVVPDFSTPLVVYCDHGERAALAAETLLKMGYQNVRSLKGGLQNWLESGGVVEVPSRFRKSAYGWSRQVE